MTTDAASTRRHTSTSPASHSGTTLTDALIPISPAPDMLDLDVGPVDPWGRYAAAVHRWEELTRPAPPPTVPDGRGGAKRLSAAFTEWLMGYPAGWVTDILPRAAAIRACGNGVVPQQAQYAIETLLDRIVSSDADT